MAEVGPCTFTDGPTFLCLHPIVTLPSQDPKGGRWEVFSRNLSRVRRSVCMAKAQWFRAGIKVISKSFHG